MPDFVPTRKTGPWPLLAISVLVLLLAAFLILKFRRQDQERDVVLKTPAPPVEPVRHDPTAVVAPPPPPPPPPQEPVKKDLDTLRADIEKALAARRWDDAAKLLEGAKEVDDLRRKLEEGKQAEEKAKQEAKEREERQRRRDQAWLAAREKIEKAKDANRWDEAWAGFETLLKDYPDLGKVEDFAEARKNVETMRRESDAIFTREMDDAEKQFQAGRFARAATVSEKVLRLYPERSGAVRAFQEKVRSAKIDSEMVRIPSAACWVGSDANPDEKPLRQVKLPAFYIDRYETTNEDYQSFVVATGHPAPPQWGGKAVPKGRERHPVLYVSYDDASSYAKWAGKRLPTAEEWEVAARGPDQREFPWGNVFSEKENVFPCNSIEYWQVQKAVPTTMAVDAPSLANGESAFRVFGMGGNAWEWTSTGTPGKSGDALLEFRILKGGSFLTPSKALRCANVLAEDPRLGHPDVGFRCARDAK